VRRLAIAAVAVSIAATLGVAVASGALDNGATSQGFPPASPIPLPNAGATTVSAAVKASLAVFQRARSASDALPAVALDAGLAQAQHDFGVNPALSRLAQTGPNASIYLVPGSIEDEVCAVAILSNVASDDCAPVRDAAKLGSFGIGAGGVSGIAPEGASSMTVKHTTGATSTVPVVNGTVAYSDPSGTIASVSFVVGDTATRPVAVPTLPAP
jgi:hypothetical protein